MNLRTHIAFVSLIIMVVFLIWKMTRVEPQEKPALVISGYAIEVVRASYGLECNQQGFNDSTTSNTPVAKENNILTLVSNRCNSRIQCDVLANPKDFPKVSLCSSSTMTIEYRCFMLDRLRKVSVRDMETAKINCSNPQ